MTIYPLLSTGATCQYPISKTLTYRTIQNTLEDGSRITLADPFVTSIKWKLTYAGITDSELGELQAFFESVEGRLNEFTFLDPTANLLVWSESLSNAAWQSSTLLSFSPGIADPIGTQRATGVSNSAPGDISILQTAAIPSNLVCCFSVYARCSAGGLLRLNRDTKFSAFPLTSLWTRLTLTGAGSGTGNTSNFGVTVPAGLEVDLFGFQVDAQPAPSTYTPTQNLSGVYPETRFDSDLLGSTADAPNSNSCQITLFSRSS